jgi:hypothetical protein
MDIVIWLRSLGLEQYEAAFRENDPRALLEPILAGIEGGETSRDVRNARALLAELV